MNKILLFFITILFSLNAYSVTNVTFWHMEGVPHRVDRIQTLIDEFNSANPDINVTQEVQNWGEIYAKAPASVAAGTAPEILVVPATFILVSNHVLFKEAKNNPEPSLDIFELFLTMIL